MPPNIVHAGYKVTPVMNSNVKVNAIVHWIRVYIVRVARNYQMFNSSVNQLSSNCVDTIDNTVFPIIPFFDHLHRLRIITASNKYWNDLLPTYTAKSDAKFLKPNENLSNFVWVCVCVSLYVNLFVSVSLCVCMCLCVFLPFCSIVSKKSLGDAECIWYTGIPQRVDLTMSYYTFPCDVDF